MRAHARMGVSRMSYEGREAVMAYNDYGAFVRRNGERMEAHEDAVLERLDGGSGAQAVFDRMGGGESDAAGGVDVEPAGQ